MTIYQHIRNIFCFITVLFIAACSSHYEQKILGNMMLPEGLYGHAVVNDGEKIFVLGGAGNNGFSRDIIIIDPNVRVIEQLKDKLLPRRYHSAVWDGKDSIYILSGVSRWERPPKLQPLVEVYDIPSKQVKIIGEMPVPRRFGSAVYIDGKIIVSGGGIFGRTAKKAYRTTDTVAIYDISSNTWRKGADLPYPESTRTVVLNQDIYAIGGFNGKTASKHVSRYNVNSDCWFSLGPLPQVLSAHSVVASQDKIYTFGDYKDQKASFVFNSQTQNWQKSALKFQQGRHNAATLMGDTIYVIGGNLGPNGPFLNTIQELSIE